MPIINLKKYYYPLIQENTFIEVSDEVAEALLDLYRAEDRSRHKINYHKAYYSLDAGNGIENDIIEEPFPSPEEILLAQEEVAYNQLMVQRLLQAIETLSSTQARRLRARFVDKKTLRAIAIEEGVSVSGIIASLEGAQKKLRLHFNKRGWKRWEDCQ